MRKYFCDSCGKEVKTLNVFEIPCHLFSKSGRVDDGYSDNDGNSISGRMDEIDLCNKCWNVAYSAALKSLNVENLNKLKKLISK